MQFEWLTFDEVYGKSPAFLESMHGRQQKFVAEVPVTFMGWITPPRVTNRALRLRRGRPHRKPRLIAGKEGPLASHFCSAHTNQTPFGTPASKPDSTRKKD